jgi:hypothetical protein
MVSQAFYPFARPAFFGRRQPRPSVEAGGPKLADIHIVRTNIVKKQHHKSLAAIGLVSAIGAGVAPVQAADMPESWRPASAAVDCSVLKEMSFSSRVRFLRENPDCKPAPKDDFTRSLYEAERGSGVAPSVETTMPVEVTTTAAPPTEGTQPPPTTEGTQPPTTLPPDP